jgi:hypothetical protein
VNSNLRDVLRLSEFFINLNHIYSAKVQVVEYLPVISEKSILKSLSYNSSPRTHFEYYDGLTTCMVTTCVSAHLDPRPH